MDKLGSGAERQEREHAAGLARGGALAVPFLGLLAALQMSVIGINDQVLPTIAGDLGIVGTGLVAAASVASIAAAATVISAGLLADRVGRRRVLIAGLLIGTLGCVLTAIAPTAAVYFAAQVLAGVGFGTVFGASFAYVSAVAPTGKVSSALGVFGASFAVVSLVILFIAEALPASGGRLEFFVPAVVAVVGAVLVPAVLQVVSGHSSTSSDWLGHLLLVGGIGSVLLGLSQVGAPGWALIPLTVGVALLLSFYLVESKASHAFFPTTLFETPTFLAAVLAGLIYSFGFAAAMLSARLLWPFLAAEETTDLSVWQLPLGIGMIAGAFITGRRMSAFTAVRSALFFGAMLTAVGLVALAAASRESSVLACLPGLVLTGAGAGAVSVPFGYLVIRSAPSTAFGPVTGVRVAVGEFGYAFAVALTALVMSRLTIGDGMSHALTVTLGIAALVVLVAGVAAAYLLRGTDSEQAAVPRA